MASEFSKWRQRFWPIHRHEHKKFVPLFILKFLFTINFCLLGSATKDTLIVTAPGSGAEVIPILKGWVVLPFSILMLVLYTKLSNKLSQEKLFYTVLGAFLTFFLLFGFVLYPLRDSLSPTGLSDWLLTHLGETRSHWVAVIRHWMNSLFFVVAELWGTMVLVLLFWSFANNINRISEAKRSYTLFVASGNLAPIVGGLIVCAICPSDTLMDFGSSIQKITLFSSAVIVLSGAIFWWMQRYVVTDEKLCPADVVAAVKKDKPKLTLRESIKYVFSSKYILCIAVLVVSYAFAINIIEVTWKACLKLQFPDSNAYQNFMGKVNIVIGMTTPIVAFLAGGNLIRKVGWYRTARLVPILIGVTGLFFLGAYMLRDQLTPLSTLFGMTPLYFIIILGLIQNVTSKALKYSLFDPTKEMAFIPLDAEAKIKGKASVDVVGSRLGKAGSSWTQALLIELFGLGSVLNISNIILPLIALIVAGWWISLRSLNKNFEVLAQETENAVTKTPLAD